MKNLNGLTAAAVKNIFSSAFNVKGKAFKLMGELPSSYKLEASYRKEYNSLVDEDENCTCWAYVPSRGFVQLDGHGSSSDSFYYYENKYDYSVVLEQAPKDALFLIANFKRNYSDCNGRTERIDRYEVYKMPNVQAELYKAEVKIVKRWATFLAK